MRTCWTQALFLTAATLLAAGCVRSTPTDPDVVPAGPGHAGIALQLTAFIEHEMRDKAIPALSIALVDGDRTVWARGFGAADAPQSTEATANTVYRIGSVSKLFTDIGIMQLVEQGELDLDAPVETYLPDFRPANPSGKPITLRHLMAHRSGLTREPPVGNYFDPADTSLANMVSSVGQTTLWYPPGERAKYSNAAIGTVGYLLAKQVDRPFAPYLKRTVLGPIGLRSSAFEPEPALLPRLAAATMWTFDERVFPAPTFQLGMAPAGSMYSTVHDLARFAQVLFDGGRGAQGPVLKSETLEKMWEIQFASPAALQGYGLGFMVDRRDGSLTVSHGGAIYGFATDFRAMPNERLAVVVVATKDAVNQVIARIGGVALGLLRHRKTPSYPPPVIDTTQPVPDSLARRLEGRWQNDTTWVDLAFERGKLNGWKRRGETRFTLKWRGANTLILDDEFGFGPEVRLTGSQLLFGSDTFTRAASPARPAEPPPAWRGLIGEYGWDHNTLFILERDGELTALIEWFTAYPLTQRDDSTWSFPDYGLYPGEHLIFRRDPSGRAREVKAANVVFARRNVGPEDGSAFKIATTRPVPELRAAALAASPPNESGEFLQTDLVELLRLDPTIRLDIRYADTTNVFSTTFYDEARAFLQRPAALALVRAHRRLRAKGYGLLIHDAYRPWYVSKMFWDGTSDANHTFVADPRQGSKHNRGAAVDLTMFELASGRPIVTTGSYDEFSNRSFPFYPGGTARQRWYRDLLRSAMEAEGFVVTDTEWWHFDYRDWPKYRIGNQTFDEIH